MSRLSTSDIDDIIERIAANDPTLTTVNLQYKGLGDDDAVRIAAALRGNTHITRLWLYNNQIGNVGATALAAILADNSAITELRLGNRIGDDGAASIAAALRTNATLTTLYLSNNQIDVIGATAFVNALWSNTALTALGLKYNQIGAELEEDIQALVRINEEEEEPEDARRSKIVYRIGRLVETEDGTEREAAVDLALDELAASFPEVAQRRGLFEQLLGSPKRGADVARSVETVPRGRALYWYAAECGAAPAVLMNILRAHPSLCGTCRDVRHKLYPFMLLATLPNSKVGDVMELLLENPSLVEGGIPEDIPKKEG